MGRISVSLCVPQDVRITSPGRNPIADVIRHDTGELWNALFTKFFSREDIPASSFNCQVTCACVSGTLYSVSRHSILLTISNKDLSKKSKNTYSYLTEYMSTIIIQSWLCQEITQQKISEAFGISRGRKVASTARKNSLIV